MKEPMTIKVFIRYKLERLIVWALERCLLNQAWVITREFKKLTDRANKFEGEVKFVAADHWKHLNELHERLLKLESKVQ